MLGIYFADCKLWMKELEEIYTCSFKALKGLTKNQVNEEVQYLHVTVLAISDQNKKAKEDQNQVVVSIPFYIIK